MQTKFDPQATDRYDLVNESNFNDALNYCLSLARTFPMPERPPILSLEALSALAVYLDDSGMVNEVPALKRMIVRISFESLMQTAGGRYNFDRLHVGDTVFVPRCFEAKVRQAMMRFRARQPLWQLSLRAIPFNPHLMVLARNR